MGEDVFRFAARLLDAIGDADRDRSALSVNGCDHARRQVFGFESSAELLGQTAPHPQSSVRLNLVTATVMAIIISPASHSVSTCRSARPAPLSMMARTMRM